MKASRQWNPLMFVIAVGFAVIFAGCAEKNKTEMPPDRLPGVSAGGYYLPSGWRLTPAGSHVGINDLPTNIVISPDGNYAAILTSGWQAHTVNILDLSSNTICDSVIVNRAFLGLAFNPAGDRLYVSGGNQDKLHELAFQNGRLAELPGFSFKGLSLENGGNAYFWSGVAVHPGTGVLYAADCNNSNIVRFDAESRAFIDSIHVGARPYTQFTRLPAPTHEYPYGYKSESVTSPAHPYTMVFHPDGKTLFLSNWADRSVSVLAVKDRVVARMIAVGEHPNDMALSADGRLFVANASSNTVSIIDVERLQVTETISTTLYPLAPEGSTPNALAVDNEGKRVFVANADNNCLAVIDISRRGASRVTGFIPTGWYPSSLAFDAKRNFILVGNGKGLASAPNPEFGGPQRIPDTEQKPGYRDYIGKIITGAVSILPVPGDAELERYTRQVYENSPYTDEKLTVAHEEESSVIPAKVGDPSPIKYVIYILKENRTYDQVFGDLPQGNGDPDICLFPREVSPNHHEIAENYVLFDNMYCDAEVSADGHQWSFAAYATDYIEKTWQASYGRKGAPRDPTYQLTIPPSLYIWDLCARFGVSYVCFRPYPSPALQGHVINLYTRQDFKTVQEERANNYLDRRNVDRWIEVYDRFAAGDSMPRFQSLNLPNDHNYGTAPGRPTPKACVSDNDHAIGRLIEHVSKGKYWKETAIFMIEDDAQNGPDHVDCHRTVALVASPYAKRGHVDHTFYTTSSILRTMELILGLPPMSQYDAASTPMFRAFTDEPDFSPYAALPPGPDIDKVNPPEMYGWQESEEFNKLGIDGAPDLDWSRITWKAIKGADSEMPAPVRRGFLFKENITLAQAEAEDDK